MDSANYSHQKYRRKPSYVDGRRQHVVLAPEAKLPRRACHSQAETQSRPATVLRLSFRDPLQTSTTHFRVAHFGDRPWPVVPASHDNPAEIFGPMGTAWRHCLQMDSETKGDPIR